MRAAHPGVATGPQRRLRRPQRAIAHTKEARSRSQLALDVVFDEHPFLTDRDGTTLELEGHHPGFAGVELTIREIKADGLAHVPSGTFTANAAWLGRAYLAHNLARWTLRAPRHPPRRRRPCPLFVRAWPPSPPAWPTAADPSACAPPNWNWPDAYERAMATIRRLAVPS